MWIVPVRLRWTNISRLKSSRFRIISNSRSPSALRWRSDSTSVRANGSGFMAGSSQVTRERRDPEFEGRSSSPIASVGSHEHGFATGLDELLEGFEFQRWTDVVALDFIAAV